MLGRPKNQAAPTATDVEHALAGRETKFPAYVVELVFLRVFERIGFAMEIGTRINHAGIQPKAVKRVRDVVMMLDVRAVAATAMPEPSHAGAERMSALCD